MMLMILINGHVSVFQYFLYYLTQHIGPTTLLGHNRRPNIERQVEEKACKLTILDQYIQ